MLFSGLSTISTSPTTDTTVISLYILLFLFIYHTEQSDFPTTEFNYITKVKGIFQIRNKTVKIYEN